MADELTGGPESAAPEESFADLFEAYEGGTTENLKIGDRVRGRIISVEKDSVFVDTGTKMDGVVNKAELLDDKGEIPYVEGQEIDLYVTAIGGGTISLSKAMSGQGGLDLLREAYDNKVPVEGKVREACKGGFSVTVMNRRAFCPQSQIDLRFASSPDDYVGNSYQFLITKFEDKGRNIVVSRRVLLELEQKESTEQFRSSVQPGDIIEGKVVRIQPFGAFVELIPGIEGLVHVSELSWSRVDDPAEAVAVGDPITVKLLGMEERADKRGRMEMKISLSAKQAGPNPWDSVEGTFKAGDKVNGKVTRLTNFGAFVELAPGIEGLVHISEMSYVKRVHRPEDIVQPGQTISVLVKEIDLKKRRISLSLREAEGDPWQDVPEQFKAGQSVVGTLEKKEQFGFFITLAPGVTGLLPKSRISKSAKPADLERLNPGDQVTVVVEEVRPVERKITLGLGDSREEGDWKKFSKEREKDNRETPMGSLADKLQAAMQAKKDR